VWSGDVVWGSAWFSRKPRATAPIAEEARSQQIISSLTTEVGVPVAPISGTGGTSVTHYSIVEHLISTMEEINSLRVDTFLYSIAVQDFFILHKLLTTITFAHVKRDLDHNRSIAPVCNPLHHVSEIRFKGWFFPLGEGRGAATINPVIMED